MSGSSHLNGCLIIIELILTCSISVEIANYYCCEYFQPLITGAELRLLIHSQLKIEVQLLH